MNLRDFFISLSLVFKETENKQNTKNILSAGFPSVEREVKLGRGQTKTGCTDIRSLPHGSFSSYGSSFNWSFISVQSEVAMSLNNTYMDLILNITPFHCFLT